MNNLTLQDIMKIAELMKDSEARSYLIKIHSYDNNKPKGGAMPYGC